MDLVGGVVAVGGVGIRLRALTPDAMTRVRGCCLYLPLHVELLKLFLLFGGGNRPSNTHRRHHPERDPGATHSLLLIYVVCIVNIGAADGLIVIELIRLHDRQLALGVRCLTNRRLMHYMLHIIITLIELALSCLELSGCPVHASLLQVFHSVL